MSRKKPNLVIVPGGKAGVWIRRFYPNFADPCEIVALVVIGDNIYSNAAMFAAIEASTRGNSVDVEAMAARVTRG